MVTPERTVFLQLKILYCVFQRYKEERKLSLLEGFLFSLDSHLAMLI